MEKIRYEYPTIEITSFFAADSITTSTGGFDEKIIDFEKIPLP